MFHVSDIEFSQIWCPPPPTQVSMLPMPMIMINKLTYTLYMISITSTRAMLINQRMLRQYAISAQLLDNICSVIVKITSWLTILTCVNYILCHNCSSLGSFLNKMGICFYKRFSINETFPKRWIWSKRSLSLASPLTWYTPMTFFFWGIVIDVVSDKHIDDADSRCDFYHHWRNVG